MADIQTDSAGLRRYTYADRHGRRRSIRLGRIPLRQARTIPPRIDALVAAQVVGSAPDAGTLQRLASIGDTLRDRLASHGLVDARRSAELGAFIDRWIAERDDVKASTTTTYKRTRRKLLAFYGASRELRTITPGSGDDFRRWLLRGDPDRGHQPVSEATTRKTCSIAGQILRSAKRHGLVEADPFTDLPTSPMANRSRDHYVTVAEAEMLLDACPDAGWRCAVALGRFGGLRVPSELRTLKLADIDWGGDGRAARFTVTSPKTEGKGKPERVVPLFAELEPYVRAAYEAAPEGAVYLLPDHVRDFTAPAVALARFIRSAGLTPWRKPWQNLRASAETDLMAVHPAHAVLAWIGHTRAVAERHYLQVTEENFLTAAGGADERRDDRADAPAAGAGRAAHPRPGDDPAREASEPAWGKDPVARGVARGTSARGRTEPASGAENRPDGPEKASGRSIRGPYWTRTSDLLDVNETR